MHSSHEHWLRRFRLPMILALFLLLAGPASAQESVTVTLASRGGSAVSGTAVLTAEGEATNVALEVTGLPANAAARAIMTAGTCDQPGASFAELPSLQADANGRATASGKVLFRGTEDVALAAMADGEHIVSVQTEQVVACGVIPVSASGAPAAPNFPETGGTPGWFVALVVLVGGALVAALIALLRRPRPAARS